MMRSLMMRLLVVTVLVPCVSVPTSAAMNGPDPQKLTIVTFNISGRKLHLPLPSSDKTRDLDEVRQPIATKIDIENTFSSPVTLMQEMWDWRTPLHLYGSISITASAVRVNVVRQRAIGI